MNFKSIIEKYIDLGEHYFQDLVTRLYKHEDNFNNNDQTSGQRIFQEYEIELKLREAYTEYMIGKFDWLDLEISLKNFDYSYQMSDSHAVFMEWSTKESELRSVIERALKLDGDRTNKLINQYRPKHECVTDFRVD